MRFTPGVPVKPMLAKATTGISEVLDKFSEQEFTCEYKYDGERAQVHFIKDGGKVFIYRCAAAYLGTCQPFRACVHQLDVYSAGLHHAFTAMYICHDCLPCCSGISSSCWHP